MAVTTYSGVKTVQSDLLTLVNDRSEPVVSIKFDGSVELKNNHSPDTASIRFWEAVGEFLPMEKSEYVDNKLMLIKAFIVLEEIRKDVQFANSASKDKFEEIFARMDEYFKTSRI